MPEKRPILPLRNVLSILPIGELGVPREASFLDTVGIDYFSIVVDESRGTITISTQIAFLDEVALGMPGVEDFELVIGSDQGISSFPFRLKFGNEFEFSLTELRSLIRIPPSILMPAIRPVGSTDENAWERNTESPYQVTLPPISFTLDNNLNVKFEGIPSLSLPPAYIGDTGLVFEARGIQLYLDADAIPPTGRPSGFKGLYIEEARLYLPKDFVLGDVIISLREAGVGNGGVFGTVLLNWDNRLSEEEPFVSGPATGTFLDVPFALKEISLTLDQNIPTEASLHSELLLPFFNKAVSLQISIEINGNFSFTLGAASNAANPGLVQLDIPELLEITVDSFTGEKIDDVGIFSIKGQLKPLLEGMDWPTFDIDQLSVDTEGNIEFDGGWVNIPESFTLDFNAFKIGISQFGFGTEGEKPSSRQWIGLSGELTLVEGLDLTASVEGLKFSWLQEPDARGDRNLQVSLTGVAVAFEIPNTLSFEGSVSYYKFDEPDPATGLQGDLFKGNIRLNLMAVRLEIEAELMIGKLRDADGNEFTTFFIVLGAQLPAGIPLGATGTSLYGIQGLAAIHAGPTKTESQNWYEWYLAAPERNITSIRKWMPIYDNYGFGAGVTIGTIYDDGFTINMSVMLVVLVPGPVIILEGKANLLKQRSDNKDEEGAFYLLAVLDGRAGTFMLNIDVRYTLEDVITVGAGLEAFFDFNDSENWYVYIGRKEPANKRLRAEILSLFQASAYFMIDSKSLMTGASVGLDISETFGPVAFQLIARISFDATIFWKPLQLEGALEMYAEISLKVFGVGIELYLQMLLEGKVPEPYYIHGLARMGIALFWPLPDLELQVEFTWTQPGETEPVSPFVKSCAFIHHKDNSATWPALLNQADLQATEISEWLVVPVDARPVLTFARPVHNLQRHETSGVRFPLLNLTSDEVGGKSFVYNLDQLELQEWRENIWQPIRTGINTGSENEFCISKENILNLQETVEPNEPQVQLWRYHAQDLTDRYQRENYNDHHPSCNPKSYQQWMTVDWIGVPNGTIYDHDFYYGGLHFVSDELQRGNTPRIGPRPWLYTTNTYIHFPEPVYYVVISLMDAGPSIVGYTLKDGVKTSDMIFNGSVLLYQTTTPIDAIRIEGSTVIIASIRYMSMRSVLEQIEDTNDNHEHVTRQNVNGDLLLRPATHYRLKVASSVNVNGSARNPAEDFIYFRTDEGPGIHALSDRLSPTESSVTVPYQEKTVHHFASYIERTLPLDGAMNFYYGYDMGIQFNESYVPHMFPEPLKMLITDRNGKTLEEPEGLFINGFLPLLPFGLLGWLRSKEEGGCARGNQPETPAPYLNFATTRWFKPNSLYAAELIARGSAGPQELHKVTFTTSRYATFTEHILSAYPEGTISSIRLPEVTLTGEIDLGPQRSERNTYKARLDEFRRSTGALNKFSILDGLKKSTPEITLSSRRTFDALNEIALRAFSAVGMDNRPAPEHVEIFSIPVTGTDKSILLIESPEPITWERITAEAQQGADLLQLGFIWNEDQTRAFIYHEAGHLFSQATYEVTIFFSGEANPLKGFLLKNGRIVDETINFSLIT